jgi:hypothetical protein
MQARTLFIAGLALAGTAQAAEITIYKQPNFAGAEQTFNRDYSSLQGSGIYDQSKSVVVRSGRWQVCSQPNFGGDCQVLDRGEYASLPQQLNGRIESLREVTRVAEAEQHNRWRWEGGGWREREDRYGSAQRGDDRYARDSYAHDRNGTVALMVDGNWTRYDHDVDNLVRSPYRDGAERMVIREGRWEVCALPDYRGVCRTFDPGVYANLGRFNSQIGSIRRIG